MPRGVLVVLALGAGCNATPDALRRPGAVCVDPTGSVLVADYQHHRVVRFDAEGRFVETFGSFGLDAGQLWRPNGLWCDTADEVFVIDDRVADPNDTDSHLWQLVQFVGGRHRASHPLLANADQGQGAWIGGVAREASGSWLIAESERGRLTRIDADWTTRSAGPGGTDLQSVEDIDLQGDDVWLVEQYAHRVSRIGPDGTEEVRIGQFGRGPADLVFPTAAAVCAAQGWIAVADLGNHRIQRYDLQGLHLGGFAPERTQPDIPVQILDLATTSDCSRLYVVDSKGNRVLVTTPAGELLATLATW